eukprot:CAMPEP_0174321356 /NCGR_PEP_ID=MMETSP0810-20121108/10229_1 /TAXON_ID=73025 ORGANISM="Eutreptiella gymnastica-like, Strain CCMP1594" /NCGR_SAMPLE_ID=MMETSP0810 /ASSEMBLY_ACC=CAM_ASM_000659 /LENGTH=42 /DNA_ID= /DNA_START= /DNA_END= /DNA_ORIENTATION=
MTKSAELGALSLRESQERASTKLTHPVKSISPPLNHGTHDSA